MLDRLLSDPRHPATKVLRAAATGRPEAVADVTRLVRAAAPIETVTGYTPEALGWAFEFAVGFDLAATVQHPQHLNAMPRAVAIRILRDLGAAIPTGATPSGLARECDLEADPGTPAGLLDGCLYMGRFEDVLHNLGRQDPRWCRHLLEGLPDHRQTPTTAVGKATRAALGALWDGYRDTARCRLRTLGAVTAAPALREVRHTPDLLAGSTLVEIKTGLHPTDDDIREALDQVLGYALLDVPDEHGVRQVALYSPDTTCSRPSLSARSCPTTWSTATTSPPRSGPRRHRPALTACPRTAVA